MALDTTPPETGPTEEEKEIIRTWERGEGQVLTYEQMRLIRVWEAFKVDRQRKRDEESIRVFEEFNEWVASLDDFNEQSIKTGLIMTGVTIVVFVWLYIEITYGPFVMRLFL